MDDIERLAELLRESAPEQAAEAVALTMSVREQLLKANRRAMSVQKELALPAGTIVISPDTGTWGVIGKDGLLDPGSVQPLTPDWSVGGIFYTPSGKPVGSDGSGQSLIGPGYVGKDRFGIGAAVAGASRGASSGRLDVRAAVDDAQAVVAKGVMPS